MIGSLHRISGVILCKVSLVQAWNGMENDFSVFHTGYFLLFYFYSILKILYSIFHSILKFSSVFHSITLPQGKLRPEATRNLYCNVKRTFGSSRSRRLAVISMVQYTSLILSTIAMTYHKNSLSIKILIEGWQNANDMQ